MARELRRLLIPPDRLQPVGRAGIEPAGTEPAGTLVQLEPAEAHYVARVLRFRRGDELAVIDGAGSLWSAILEQPAQLRLQQPLAQPLQRVAPPQPQITLAMAVPKRDPELVWRMAAELGASRLQPLIASRSVVRSGLPLERWRTILREATEQCERLWLPELADPLPTAAWFAAPVAGPALLATSRRPDLPRLPQLAAAIALAAAPRQLSLAIGPEGGWTPEEEESALAAGWQLVSLGEAILRTSTAAVAGLACLALAPWAGVADTKGS